MPTARELVNSRINTTERICYHLLNIENIMIEFAELHVKAALEEASEKAKINFIESNVINHIKGLYSHQIYDINKESILNSYLEENIK